MEIEGIINHARAAVIAKKHKLIEDLSICTAELVQWENLQLIHANEELQQALIGIHNTRQLFSDEAHMQYFISTEPEDMFMFKGFRLQYIDYYLSLRVLCSG